MSIRFFANKKPEMEIGSKTGKVRPSSVKGLPDDFQVKNRLVAE